MSKGHDMSSETSSRRDFLKTAVVGTSALTMTARSYGRVRGSNERIGLGVIGCGRRGFGVHMPAVQKHAQEQNLEITAVCDVWTKHRKRAVETAKSWFGRAPFATTAYRELLNHDNVDAVMIASCDFQHPHMLAETAKAGKDAYCEKPLAMDLDELKATCRAVTDSGIIVQIGTQRRSDPDLNGARKLYQSGILGEVSRIEVFSNAGRPNWYKRLVRLPIEETEVDWRQFLMHRPERPFDDLLFAGWFGYREFCGGSIGQFMSHYADLVNFLTGSRFPTSAVAHGDTFVWNDEHHFDCRDQVQVSLIYPEGFLFTYVTNFGNGSGNRSVIYGTEGVMDVRGRPTVRGEGSFNRSRIRQQVQAETVPCPDHFLNWFQCLRSRRQPVAPLEAGYEHSIACIMADRALQTGQRQTYDAEQGEIRPG